ncbi:MAG: YchJ family metal-binding protein, partial [Bilophila sp.]
MTQCPCCSGRTYEDCCAPYVEGRESAPTAEALMRSRYTAHALGKYDYLNETV